MPEEKEPPRPHGDKLKGAAGSKRSNLEDNPAQAQSDAPSDAHRGLGGGREESDRDRARGSTANGVPEFEEGSEARRKRQYEDGAEIVSGID
jgi:hypothetical protein